MANRPNFTFLLIDDKKDRMGPFIDAAKQRSVRIVATDNVEEGLAKLKADPDLFNGIILDALCKLKRSDTEEQITEKPLRLALREISNLEERLDKLYPKCVYTADDKAARNNDDEVARVFRKGPLGTERTLFDYLIGEVKSNPVRIVEHRYQDVLTLFEAGYLPASGRDELFQLLLEFDERHPNKVKANLTRVRKTLEMLLHEFSVKAPAKLSPTVLQSASGVSDGLHLLGAQGSYKGQRERVLPEHLFSILYTTQKAASATGSHYYEGFVSHYAMRSLAYGMLEALLWFKQYIDENHPDTLSG